MRTLATAMVALLYPAATPVQALPTLTLEKSAATSFRIEVAGFASQDSSNGLHTMTGLTTNGQPVWESPTHTNVAVAPPGLAGAGRRRRSSKARIAAR